jgi:hypothetical protein
MPTYDLYSKRQKGNGDDVPEVFQYEELPKTFRVQVVYILWDVFGKPPTRFEGLFQRIHNILCRKHGILCIGSASHLYQDRILNFLVDAKHEELEKILNVIEFAFRSMSFPPYKSCADLEGIKINPAEAIAELNERFLEHRIGYQFESNKIIRIDSKFIHNEAVKPALRVLTDDMYKGANDEFLKAHDHYRHGRYKECLNECLKSFESTMKAICTKRGWAYDGKKATASNLIKICFQNNLIPDYMQLQFTSLQSSLESGIPTVRNRTSGHGQGSEISEVPSYLASYLLHLTATTILLFADAEKALA